MPDATKKILVSNDQCKSRRNPIYWVVKTILALMMLLMVVLGWYGFVIQDTKAESIEAKQAANEVQQGMAVHNAGTKEWRLSITKTLDRIEKRFDTYGGE